MQPKEIVNVGLFLHEWSSCLSAKHQRDQLYRCGAFDDCARQWQDVKDSLRAKLERDETAAQQIIQQTYYHQRTAVSPTIGVIWEQKETPGWD